MIIASLLGLGVSVAGQLIATNAAAKDQKQAAVDAIAATNPCVARVSAQLTALGAPQVMFWTDAAKREKEQRTRLEAELQKYLRDPMACPEVRNNLAAQQKQNELNQQSASTVYTIVAVGMVGLVGLGAIILATRPRKKKKKSDDSD